jgi:hypothetical protein
MECSCDGKAPRRGAVASVRSCGGPTVLGAVWIGWWVVVAMGALCAVTISRCGEGCFGGARSQRATPGSCLVVPGPDADTTGPPELAAAWKNGEGSPDLGEDRGTASAVDVAAESCARKVRSEGGYSTVEYLARSWDENKLFGCDAADNQVTSSCTKRGCSPREEGTRQADSAAAGRKASSCALLDL